MGQLEKRESDFFLSFLKAPNPVKKLEAIPSRRKDVWNKATSRNRIQSEVVPRERRRALSFGGAGGLAVLESPWRGFALTLQTGAERWVLKGSREPT